MEDEERVISFMFENCEKEDTERKRVDDTDWLQIDDLGFRGFFEGVKGSFFEHGDGDDAIESLILFNRK